MFDQTSGMIVLFWLAIASLIVLLFVAARFLAYLSVRRMPSITRPSRRVSVEGIPEHLRMKEPDEEDELDTESLERAVKALSSVAAGTIAALEGVTSRRRG